MRKSLKKLVIVVALSISITAFPENSSAGEFYTNVNRIVGANRYSTSISVSQKNFSKAENVIIASGEDFPDAISSGSLSHILDAPILLVSKGPISNDIKTEIKRLKASKIYVIGGNARIDEKEVAKLGLKYDVIAGVDRYHTSELVLKKYEEISSGSSSDPTVQNDIEEDNIEETNVTEEVESSSAIIEESESTLSSETQDKASTENLESTTESIDTTKVEELESTTENTNIEKIEESSIAKEELQEENIENESSNSEIIIASGMNYPDALTASYMSYKLEKPILLVNGEKNSKYLDRATYGVGSLNVLNLSSFDGKLIFGSDRYETNRLVLEYLNVDADELIICSGMNYPDALVAASFKKPIALSGDVGFTRNMIKYISNQSPKNITFVGGDKPLPKILEDQVIGGIEDNFANVPLPAPMKSNTKGKVMILSYHNIGQFEHRYQRTPEGLKYDMLQLYKKGYLPVSLKDYMAGKIDIPKGYTPYVITFDDGSTNNFRYLSNGTIDPDCAYALLKDVESKLEHFNPHATFFISLKTPFGQPEYVKQKFDLMLSSGMDIGNHTFDHINLKNNPSKIEYQIAMQKQNLQKYLPKDYEVNLFAIPNSTRHTSAEYKRIISGNYQGIKYNNLAIGAGFWEPDDFPNKSEYRLVKRIPATRIGIQGIVMPGWTGTKGIGLYDYVEYFDRNPSQRYVK